MQHQETTIGGFHTGGLGDVKYLPIGNPFKGEWSRPQPDGPAARVITLVMFANHLLDFGTADDRSFVTNKLYDGKDVTESIIKGDLEYLGKHWGDAGFDRWYFSLLGIFLNLNLPQILILSLSTRSMGRSLRISLLHSLIDSKSPVCRISLSNKIKRLSFCNFLRTTS